MPRRWTAGSCHGLENVDEGGVVVAELAAARSKAGVRHLPLAGTVRQLLPQLVDGEEPCDIGWMPARQTAARGADGNAPPERGPPGLSLGRASAAGRQSQCLARQHLDDGARGIELGKIEIAWVDARGTISRRGGALCGGERDHVVWHVAQLVCAIMKEPAAAHQRVRF